MKPTQACHVETATAAAASATTKTITVAAGFRAILRGIIFSYDSDPSDAARTLTVTGLGNHADSAKTVTVYVTKGGAGPMILADAVGIAGTDLVVTLAADSTAAGAVTVMYQLVRAA